MENFEWNNIVTPIISFVGVIIAAFLAFLSSSFLKKKETKLKISEKILDKKLEAHEDVLKLSKYLRSTISDNRFSSENELISYPIILSSKANYYDWKKDLFIKANNNSHWLTKEVKQELFFIQDYIINLDKTLENVPDENLIKVAIILKKDFIDLSNNLERSIIKYFDKGWKNLKIISTQNIDKLPKSITQMRLEKYNYNVRYLDISSYFYKKNDALPPTDIKPVTFLYDIAPNGMKINMVKIIEIANLDNSGIEYELFFQENEYINRYEKFGYCELVSGYIRFDKISDTSKYVGVSNEALELLCNWISENKER